MKLILVLPPLLALLWTTCTADPETTTKTNVMTTGSQGKILRTLAHPTAEVGTKDQPFLERAKSFQYITGKQRPKRSLYEECYGEGCNYEEVTESLHIKSHADAYWNQYKKWSLGNN